MHTVLGGVGILMLCSVGVAGTVNAQTEWYTYRHDPSRTGSQLYASDLPDPAKVAHLSVQQGFPKDGDPPKGAFWASPIVVNDTLFIGSADGYFYALDGESLMLKWQFPKLGDPPLLGSCGQPPPPQPPTNHTFGQYGIRSSATYAKIGDQDAIIFGAPDPSYVSEGAIAGIGLGSARLFALNAQTGQPIWKADGAHVGSEVVAHVTGCSPGSTSERHETIAYSSPLVLGDRVYVGIHDDGDNPIQNGQVIAVDLNTGQICVNHTCTGSDFHYQSVETGKRGGGVWNSPATDGTSIYFTTGNTRNGNTTEPSPNRGLSMIGVNKDTGELLWGPNPFRPVTWDIDNDPDWAAGATIMNTSCGELIASVQKDGWSYALNAGDGTMRWQLPATGLGKDFKKAMHGDTHYKRPGAAWNDVFLVTTGGEARFDSKEGDVALGYDKLHALNACAATDKDRVRWIADLGPPHSTGGGYALGAPTVTGGIVFIGTDQGADGKGHLIVLADPSIVSGTGYRCSDINYPTPSDCTAAGHVLVPIPKVLRDVPMPDSGNIAGLRNEAALANGRVYVGTLNGHVYMLDGFAPPVIAAVQPNHLRCGDTATPVIVTGLNFNDVLDVTLHDSGGVAHQVSFDRNSETQISPHIPNTISSGSYGLVVHTAHGSSDPSQFLVTPIVNNTIPTMGPPTGGTEITISGSCFHNPQIDPLSNRSTMFYFGGNQASVVWGCASSSQCSVSSPATSTAGPVDVVAVDEGASSASTPPNPQFSYAGPNITGISPKSGPITGGTSVEITGSGFPAYDGIHPLNMQVSFDGVQTMAECFVTDCNVATLPAMRAGAVHIIATAFGVSSTPSPADQFTYNQFPELTKFLAPTPPNSGNGSVYLDGNAPADGPPILLTSSDPNAVFLQRTAPISAGSYWTSVPVTFLPTSKTETVTLTAMYQGSSASTTVNVVAWPPISLALDADELDTGESTTATIRINPPAPSTGAVITLSSSDRSVVPMPSSVTILNTSYVGTSSVINNGSGGGRKTVSITATYGNASASADISLGNDCTHCGTQEECCVCNGGVWVGGRCE